MRNLECNIEGGQTMNTTYQTLIVKFSEPITALDGIFDDTGAWGTDTLKGRVFKNRHQNLLKKVSIFSAFRLLIFNTFKVKIVL